MIEKLDCTGLIQNLEKKRSISSSLTSRPFQFEDILSQELGSSKFLEKMVLDFLIKTMESVFSNTDQKDQLFSFKDSPLSLTDFLQPHPEKSRPLSGAGTGLSIVKQNGQEIDEIIQKAAAEFELDPALIKAVISVESNGNPQAISSAGAQGLMQLMPKTAAEMGATNPFDPVQNIMAGTRYLSQLLNRYQKNLKLALAAYNWGMGNLEKNPAALPKETYTYIVRVEKQYQAYLNSSYTV